MLSLAPQQRLPNLEYLAIKTIESKKDNRIIKFLEHCAPYAVKEFDFNEDLAEKQIKFSWYSAKLLPVLSRVTESVKIWDAVIDEEDLEGIVRSCWKVQKLEIKCKGIETSENMDFGKDLKFR